MNPLLIDEKRYVSINSTKQAMFLRGENLEAPVLLFLHGGPGAPELPIEMINETEHRLESNFIVCYWEQRGAGLSYSRKIEQNDMTLNQLIKDTVSVSKYLQKRFDKKKIYLLGHSWGSYLGIKTVQKYPDEYFALINVGQVCNQIESEKQAYQYMLEHAQKSNDQKALRQLQKYNLDSEAFPEHKYMMKIRTRLMNKYGIGLHHNPDLSSNMVKNVLFFKKYSFFEKIKYVQGMLFSNKLLFHYVLEDNLFENTLSLEIPFYILQGKYDYQTSYFLAKEYLAAINAPDKKFYSFEHSAHSPIWEEPKEFMDAIKQIQKNI